MLDAGVARLSTTSMVPARFNKLPVAGQTPYKAAGPEPQQTPTPLTSQERQTPLQVYETERPFFGSAPVGGLAILCSKSSSLIALSPFACCRCSVLSLLCAVTVMGCDYMHNGLCLQASTKQKPMLCPSACW